MVTCGGAPSAVAAFDAARKMPAIKKAYLLVAMNNSNNGELHRIGGTINVAARQAPRTASAEQVRGLRSRSRQICTSRHLGAPCLLQVTTMDDADHFGLARRNSATTAPRGRSISCVAADRTAGMAIPA